MPGLGEDIDLDKEYEEIYRQVLPEMDVIIWIIQANTRDLAEDQRIIKDIVQSNTKDLTSKIVIEQDTLY